MKALDLTGQVFGRLTVVSRAENSKGGKARWNCVCECGGSTTTSTSNLRSKRTKSCGCSRGELLSKLRSIHNMSQTPEYTIWTGMKARTTKHNTNRAYIYIERGIEMCPEWRDSFERFYSDMGPRPSLEHSIDRIDNAKGYSKENCRWATRKEQARNKRNIHQIEFKGQAKCIAEWSESTGISLSTIWARLHTYNWSVERALTTPTQR